MAKAKNEHGTQVTRSIVCTNCNATDRVPFAPRNMERVLCRKCAAEILGIEDPDAGIRAERVLSCIQCNRPETTAFPNPAEFVCKDCRLGIESKQQDRSKKAARVGAGKVIRVRKADE
jgi:CxxC-x17-CxxC domain-containing protein